MKIVCTARLRDLRGEYKTEPIVEAEITKLLSGKTLVQLEQLEASVQAKLASGEPVDTDYWEGLLNSLNVWKARVCQLLGMLRAACRCDPILICFPSFKSRPSSRPCTRSSSKIVSSNSVSASARTLSRSSRTLLRLSPHPTGRRQPPKSSGTRWTRWPRMRSTSLSSLKRGTRTWSLNSSSSRRSRTRTSRLRLSSLTFSALRWYVRVESSSLLACLSCVCACG